MRGRACVGGGAVGGCDPALSRAAPPGAWTTDVREPVAFPQDAYPAWARRRDYTRAGLTAGPPRPRRRRAGPRKPRSAVTFTCLVAVLVLGFSLVHAVAAQTWRGLAVALEHRCAPYDKKREYPYPQSVERDIVRELGAVYGPYTGTCFASTRETDIEHIVAASEAHDSGLCARTQRPGPGSRPTVATSRWPHLG